MYACACCGYLTLSFPEGSLEICEVCGWVDDTSGLDFPKLAIGPNHVSLETARANYRRFGASEPRKLSYVRPPRPEEVPSDEPDRA